MKLIPNIVNHGASKTFNNLSKSPCHVKTSHHFVLIYIPRDHNNIPHNINNLINTFLRTINSLSVLYRE